MGEGGGADVKGINFLITFFNKWKLFHELYFACSPALSSFDGKLILLQTDIGWEKKGDKN